VYFKRLTKGQVDEMASWRNGIAPFVSFDYLTIFLFALAVPQKYDDIRGMNHSAFYSSLDL
jgi:hypothetical protein